jgi:hypothetical protein
MTTTVLRCHSLHSESANNNSDFLLFSLQYACCKYSQTTCARTITNLSFFLAEHSQSGAGSMAATETLCPGAGAWESWSFLELFKKRRHGRSRATLHLGFSSPFFLLPSLPSLCSDGKHPSSSPLTRTHRSAAVTLLTPTSRYLYKFSAHPQHSFASSHPTNLRHVPTPLHCFSRSLCRRCSQRCSSPPPRCYCRPSCRYCSGRNLV